MDLRPMECQKCEWTGMVPADANFDCPGCDEAYVTVTLTAPVDELETMFETLAECPEALPAHPDHDPPYDIMEDRTS